MNAGKPECDPSNPVIQNMTWALMKAPEHTWGTPGISGYINYHSISHVAILCRFKSYTLYNMYTVNSWGGGDNYNVTKFRSQLSTQAYMAASASWVNIHMNILSPIACADSLVKAEQRFFNELAVRSLEESNHPLVCD